MLLPHTVSPPFKDVSGSHFIFQAADLKSLQFFPDFQACHAASQNRSPAGSPPRIGTLPRRKTLMKRFSLILFLAGPMDCVNDKTHGFKKG
jgi:hypothetical protein